MRKLFLLFVALLATTTLWAHDFEVDGIYYNYLDDNNVAVTYKGSYTNSYNDEYSGEVTIPETVTYDGITYSVTSIGDAAFSWCSSLTSITIPNSVTSIGGSAFAGTPWYNNLSDGVIYVGKVLYNYKGTMPANTSINIKDGIVSISPYAFKDCSSLTSITIPNSVTSIGKEAFQYCSSLTSITIPNSVTSIGSAAFSSCSSLTSVTIGNSVTSIGDEAFYWCSRITSITIEAITPPSLGSGAFPSNPTAIYIPDNTLSAYQSAWGSGYLLINNENSLTLHVETPGTLSDLIFDAGMRPANIRKLTLTGTLNETDFTCMRETMTSLVDVDLSGITNTYGVNFKDKSRLIKVILPNNLTDIANYAFSSCSSLASITIPNTVTYIGTQAFYKCSFTSITIPNKVKKIKDWAFSHCSLTSITIPNSVTSIGDKAFYWCSSLTSVTIGNSVTSIGDNAFSNCYSLDTITCLGTTPPNASDLGASTSNCTLIVPHSAYNAYLRHTYWGQFLNINTGYLVTLQANNNQWGEVVGTGLYPQDSTITITATPNDGYTFMRWSDGNTDNPRTLTVTQDTTLTAEFAIEGGCLVTFVDWDGTVLSSVSVVPGEAATAPADPTRGGYTFIGWDKDFSAVTDHMTVTAQYQINRYRVRFFDDDTLLKTDSVEYQSAAIAPANPYHEGYTFTGWDQAFDSITSDLDVYAQYEMGENRDMTIVFTNSEDNDNEILSQSITIKIPAAPEIAGFTFLYWQPVAEPITNVITIQAIYEADVPSSAPEVYINPANPAQKLLRNGQVYILQDGKTYTIMGAEIQ